MSKRVNILVRLVVGNFPLFLMHSNRNRFQTESVAAKETRNAAQIVGGTQSSHVTLLGTRLRLGVAVELTRMKNTAKNTINMGKTGSIMATYGAFA